MYEKGICKKSLAKCYLFLLQSSVTREKRGREGKDPPQSLSSSFDLRDLPLLTPLRLIVPPTLQNVISREKLLWSQLVETNTIERIDKKRNNPHGTAPLTFP